MNYTKIKMSVAFFIIFFPCLCFSQHQLRTDFAVKIPFSFLKFNFSEAINSMKRTQLFQIQQKIPNKNFEMNGIHAEMQGMSFNIELTHPELIFSPSRGTYFLRGKIHGFTINVENMVLNGTVDSSFSEINGRFRLSGACEGLKFETSRGSLPIYLEVRPQLVANTFLMKLEGVFHEELNFFLNDDFDCEGVSGLKEYLKNIFASNEMIGSIVRESIQRGVSQYFESFINQKLSFSNLNPFDHQGQVFLVDQKLHSFRLNAGGDLIFYGELKVDNLRSKRLDLVESHFMEDPFLDDSKQGEYDLPLLVFPKTFTSSLLNLYFSPRAWSFVHSLNELSGIKKILNSRFLQFFTWPELLKFKKSTIFFLRHSSNDEVLFKQSKNDILMKGYVISEMKYACASGKCDFMNFYSNLMATASWKIENGEFRIQNHKFKVVTQYKWHDNYLRNVDANQFFAKNVFTSVISDWFKDKTFVFKVPRLRISETLFLNVKTYYFNKEEDLFLVYSP